MRTEGYMLQQALTPEAENVLKQALTLAKHRGHAQVTPLHVAHSMLSFSSGLLRTACLQSHSHPLQCKALELCFNVALNRLPASSSNPVFGCKSLLHPSISNALVAAFKRGQAHQRRGCIESQQQPLLTVKIELEQLIISILDDPSVSRVMQEAGFSSTQVKINVEKAVSLERFSQTTSTQNQSSKVFDHLVSSQAPLTCQNLGKLEGKPRDIYHIREEHVAYLIKYMSKSRRNIVIVGECVDNLDGLVRELMERVDKGDVNEGLKEVKFMTLSLLSFSHLSEEEVEQKLIELKSMVKRYLEKGVVLYLGDLKWISEYMVNILSSQWRERRRYCQLDHMVREIGKFCSGIGQSGTFSIIGVACFKTYMKCKSGNPSLESIWGLHSIIITDENLSLSLTHESENGTSNLQSNICATQPTSSLPSWFLKYKDEKNIDQDCVPISSLGGRTISFNPISPSCSSNRFLCNHQHSNFEPSLSLHTTSSQMEMEQTSFPYQFPTTDFTSTYLVEAEYEKRFNELTFENFKTLCTSLEKQVPSQKDIIPEIVTTIVQCRSRIKSLNKEIRKGKAKEETWMCFLGIDVDAKEKIARELSRLIFGSSSSFVSITSSSLSCSRANSMDAFRNKRSRDDQSCSYLECFSEMVCRNPHRVFFLKDIEQVDSQSKLGIKMAIESGTIKDFNCKEAWLSDAIIILNCENFNSKSRPCSPPIKRKFDNGEKEKVVSWDLNISLEDTESADEVLIDDVGLLECLDRMIIFKSQEL